MTLQTIHCVPFSLALAPIFEIYLKLTQKNMKHIYKFFSFAVVMGLCYGLNAQVIIHQQDFEDGAGDWITEGAWQIGNIAQNSSQYWVYPPNNTGNFASLNDDALGQGGDGNGLIVSPELDFTGFEQILLTFETHYPHANYAGGGQEQFGVRASTDGGLTWNSVYDFDAPALNWGRSAAVLNDYAGESSVWIAFEYNDGNNWSFGVGLDNIIIQEPKPRSGVVSLTDAVYKVIENPGDMSSFDFEITNFGSDQMTEAHIVFDNDGEMFEKTIEVDLGLGEKAPFSMDFPEAWYDADVSVQQINGEMNEEDPSNAGFAVVAPIPNFTEVDIHGEEVSLHSLLSRNHVVTLDYFASWCGPCETSTPELNGAWVEMGSGEKGFDVLGITTEPNDDADVVANLGWGAEYNKFAYSVKNEVMWQLFNAQYGESAIPMFIQICPDADNPGFGSSVDYNTVGWAGPAALTAAAQECNAAVGTDDFSESGIGSGIEDIASLNHISVYPNPVDDSSNIYFSLDQEELVTVSITDMVGKTVFTQNMGTQSGDVQVSLSDINFASGVYTVNVTIGSEIASTKINVLR